MQDDPHNRDISRLIEIVLRLLKRKGRARAAHFDYSIAITNKQISTMPLQLKITDEQKVTVTLAPVTQRGKPVKVDGVPVWTRTDGDSQIVPAADGMSAELVSADTPGISNFTVEADADLGDGVDTITDTIALTVVDPQASSLGLTAGAPVDKEVVEPQGAK